MNLDTTEFAPLGLIVNHLQEKTAADMAGETLGMDAYIGAFEYALGLDPEMNTIAKTASKQVGREIMTDFISKMLLNK